MYYKTCPHCGAHLDPGERCDCQDEKEPPPAGTGKAAEDKPIFSSYHQSGEKSSLPMTDSEIAISYRQALSPRKQVGILAHLCAVSRADILAALERQGIEVPRRKPEGRGRVSTIDYFQVEQLYFQGLNDYAIAEKLGISAQSVHNWRGIRGLPAQRKLTAGRVLK